MKENNKSNQVGRSLKDYRERGRGCRLFGIVAIVAGGLILFGAIDGYGNHRSRWFHQDRPHSEFSVEELQHRMSRAAEWLLDEVDASEEQETRVDAILEDLAEKVANFQGQRQALADQFIQAIEDSEIDRNELGEVQAAGVQLAERAIDQTFGALIEIFEVVMPEQRRELAKAWRKHHR